MKYRLLSLFFCCAFPLIVQATHYAGADIRFVWLANNVNGNVYRVFLTIYRDCTGVAADHAIQLQGNNVCNTNQVTMAYLQKTDTLMDGRPNGSQVGGFCPGTPTKCTDPGNAVLPGYEEWCYSTEIVLPTRCETWRFWVSMSNRNNSTNLHYANGYTLLLEATLNNKDAAENSSPFFTIKPTPYVCVGEPFSYNQGAVDPDGDSLSYELVNPLTQYFQTVPFAPGYNLSSPFSTNGGFYLNTLTGQMEYTPSIVSNNTISVRVIEWRKGKRIGSVMRDIQNAVIPCSTQRPEISLIEPSISGAQYKDSVLYACANIPLRFCFKVVSTSPEAVMVVGDNHQYSIPSSGLAYNRQASDSVTGCFSWRPGNDDVGMKVLIVKVRDSSCKLSNVVIDRSYAIPIIVRPADRAYHRYAICPKDTVALHSSYPGEVIWTTLEGDHTSVSLSCTRCPDPVARPSSDTRYLAYQDMGGGCINTDTIDVLVDRSNRIEITPAGFMGMCDPDSLHLSAEAFGPRPLSNVSCGAVTVPVSNVSDSVIIHTYGATRPQGGDNGATTPFSGSNKTARHQYLMRAEDIRSSGMYAGTLNSISIYALPSSSDVVYRNVRISVLCTDVNALDPGTGFISGGVQVFRADSIVLPAAGGWVRLPFTTLYNRDRNKNLVIDFCYANKDIVRPGYTSWVKSQYNSVLYASSNTDNICTYLPPTLPLVADDRMPVFRLGYNLAPELPFGYTWSSSVRSAFYPGYQVPDPTVYISRSQVFKVSTTGLNGCNVSDTLDVHLSGLTTGPKDTTICLGNSVVMDATVRFGERYKWYENGSEAPVTLSCAECPVVTATPTRTTSYMAVIEDSIGCTDTLRVQIEVLTAKGQVRILNSDTTINYGSELQLMSEGAPNYLWQPETLVSDPTIPDPVIKPLTPVVLIVTGYTEDGCKSYDTIRIDVDLRGNIYVPSAFTPNGDGKNDIFRVANMTFQELLEFRVFNRWGEQVFQTTDRTRGWDGTYNGKDQEVGTYFYLIRVRFADQEEQTFKGDVTLIR